MRLALLLISSTAYACPACVQRSGFHPLQLVLVILPFVIVGAAARAIVAALRP